MKGGHSTKIILAIGGAVIKTARDELMDTVRQDKIRMLVHNGGSVFHDFQIATDPDMEGGSYPLEDLIEDYSRNQTASRYVWDWIKGGNAPRNSVTRLCERKQIPVLLFTGLGCDFWQLFDDDWAMCAERAFSDFQYLCGEMKKPFHYVCMGSATIHPEVFIKAVALVKPENFRADVVDFKDMYRPRTRVARYGEYYMMSHKEFFEDVWNEGF